MDLYELMLSQNEPKFRHKNSNLSLGLLQYYLNGLKAYYSPSKSPMRQQHKLTMTSTQLVMDAAGY